jgi:hypothetical protein
MGWCPSALSEWHTSTTRCPADQLVTESRSVHPCATQAAAAKLRKEPSVFGRFAALWFPPMVDALVGGPSAPAPPAARPPRMNHVLLDVCVTAATWPALMPARGEALPAEAIPAAQALVGYLVRPSDGVVLA